MQCLFAGANLESADLKGATLVKSNFEECNLANARLASADAQAAVFTRCRLVRADFGSAHLQVDIRCAALRCAELCCAALRLSPLRALVRLRTLAAKSSLGSQDANFTNADCTDANFQKVSAFGVNFYAGTAVCSNKPGWRLQQQAGTGA